jgi:hypothetical protein
MVREVHCPGDDDPTNDDQIAQACAKADADTDGRCTCVEAGTEAPGTGFFATFDGTVADQVGPGERAPQAGLFCEHCMLLREEHLGATFGLDGTVYVDDTKRDVEGGDPNYQEGLFCVKEELVMPGMTGDCIWIDQGSVATGEGFAITPVYAGPVTRDMLEESDTSETFGYFCPACLAVERGTPAPLPGSFYTGETFPDHIAVPRGMAAPDDGLFCPGGTGSQWCDIRVNGEDCYSSCTESPETCADIATFLAEGGCAATCPDCLLDNAFTPDGNQCSRDELETMIKEKESATTVVVVKSPAPMVSMAWTTLIALVFAAAALI